MSNHKFFEMKLKVFIVFFALIVLSFTSCTERKSVELGSSNNVFYIELIESNELDASCGSSPVVYSLRSVDKIAELKNTTDVFTLGRSHYFCAHKPLDSLKQGLSKEQLKEELFKIEPYVEVVFN
jgi:hypothetical protein